MDHRPKSKMQTIKVLEDSIGENLDSLGYNDSFLCIISKAWSMEEIIGKLALLKLRTLALQKITSRELEDKPQTGRKYLQKTHLIRDVIQNIQRTLKTQQENIHLNLKMYQRYTDG